MANPYSRVYWSIWDDPKFDGVRDDMRLLGSWLVLLLYAEMAYPAPAHRPLEVKPAAFKSLVAAGLVDLLPGGRYRIHGLASEREMRSQWARNAAAKRWHSEGISVGNASKEREKKRKEGDAQSDRIARDPLLKEIREAYRAKEKDDA